MALGLSKIVVEYLKERAEEKFTARQIAEWIFQNYPAECEEKKNKSINIKTNEELIKQIAAEITSGRSILQERNPEIKTTESRPRQYYLTEKHPETPEPSVPIEPEDTEEIKNSQGHPIREKDIYPILSQYLWSEFRIYSKRIDEKKSTNKQGPSGNKWLFPDIVGMEDLISDWKNGEIKQLVKEYADKKTKLWSFEVKKLLNRSNVREAFFQAVSNSSWANFGYLVTAEIEGAETIKELQILCPLHGIGLIKIDINNLEESEIIIPARQRSEVDWATCNRLAENKDFQKFIELITQFYQTGKHYIEGWDLPDFAKEK